MTKCNACGCEVGSNLIASIETYNTGGDTICLACQAECVPSDGDKVRDDLIAISSGMIEVGGEPEWQQYFSDR